MQDKIKNDIKENIEMQKNIIKYCLPSIEEAATIMINCINNKGKVLW